MIHFHLVTVFSIALSTIIEPNSYNEAMKHDCWMYAIVAKVNALTMNKNLDSNSFACWKVSYWMQMGFPSKVQT